MTSIDGKERHDSFNSGIEENQHSLTQESAKNSSGSQWQEFQNKKAATSSEKGQRQSTSYKSLQPGLQNPKHSARCLRKCISDGKNNEGITEKGESQTKIPEMIYNILNGIPNLYIAIKDVKSHTSDKNSSIFNNLKTNNLTLSQINETLMYLEKALRTIETSNDDN
ncbi:hypothetical protein O181_017351 [Austropuccinia psidii MF-1]|uniref:Uncharacterized protein n=1 Tax=Austropuccinia psidii MF-1 TaxID=1389203 RepID=A0A9Q3C7F2_9BASI|nr:hypothetical protein [Austropuccinia psidii MF-1]